MIDSFKGARQSEPMEKINPYAAPQSQVLQATTQDEIIRREHIDTEASIKSVGLLYYLAALALITIGVLSLTDFHFGESISTLVPGGLLLLAGIGVGFVAHGLRRLRSWARIPTIILSSIAVIVGLINTSGGVLIHIYILVKMMGKQAPFVMTQEYQRIIAATPHVKRKTSVVMVVLLVLLVIILIGIIAAISMKR